MERDPETGDIVKDLEEPTVKEGLVGDAVSYTHLDVYKRQT